MKIRKHQQGGQMMPVEDPAMAQQAQDPMVELINLAMQALETQDPNAAFAVCEGLLMLVQQSAPVGAPAEQPVFKKGGKMCRGRKTMKRK